MFGYITQDEAVADGFTHNGTSFFLPVWIEIEEDGEIVEVQSKWVILEWFLDWCWNTEKELFGGEPETTNNRMELMAAIEGLKAIKRACHVILHTDSKYVMDGATEWMTGWKSRGWKTADKKPVKNQDLWMALDEQISRHHVKWVWVKGHNGHIENERVDELARTAISKL